MSDDRSARRAGMRRATIQLVLGTAALHAVAITIYKVKHVELAPERTRTWFVAVWLIATVLVVAPLLRRVRKLRYAR